MIQAIRYIFRKWHFKILALLASFAVFALTVWFPNLKLLFSLWTNPAISLEEKITFPVHLLESITTNFTLLSAFSTVVISLLFGFNIVLIVFSIQKRQIFRGGMISGIFGLAAGAFGVGCLACGSLVIASILSLVGGAGLIGALPLRGDEFGLLGVVLLGLSTYLLLKQINNSGVCKIK